jgi:alanyl-tRNA synthetase
MQHHSGQHVLSQAFVQAAGAETESFHLSDETSTIDLHTTEVSQDQVEQAELVANQVIWENRPVRSRLVAPGQAAEMPMRKRPPSRNGKLRLIDIEDFDLTACGGTHVSRTGEIRTGEIGIIKITKVERRGEQLRVGFRCGRRALQDFQKKNSIVNQLTANLTTGQAEVVGAVEKLQEEMKQARRTIKKQQSQLLHIEAERLLLGGINIGNETLVIHVMTHADPGQLRALSGQLTSQDHVVALLGMAGPKSQLLFSRSADAPGEMNQILDVALQVLGPTARGGGSASFAQGGGPAADRERVVTALEQAKRLLLKKI